MTPTPTDLRHLRAWSLPLGLAMICVLITVFDPPSGDALQYDRTLILQGQVWRLLTGNIVHLNFNHLWLNLGGLVLLWLFFAQCFSLRTWLLLLLLSCAGTGLGLLWLNPDLEWYVGLSGALHGLFIAGAIQDLRRPGNGERHWEGWLLLGVLIGKVLWEQYAGPMPGSEATAGGRVIVDAHLYGAVSGGGTMWVVMLVNYWKAKHETNKT